MSKNTTIPTKMDDPNVKLPAAIRALAARSDALHQEAYATDPAPQPDPQPDPQERPQPTNPTPKADPAPAKPEPAAPAPAAPQAPSPDSFEHKYNSIKGRYDQAQQRIIQLEQELAAKNAAPSPAPAKREPNPELQFKPITAEERESYGEEFIDVAARAAAERFVPTINTLQAELERVNAQLENTMRSQGASAAEIMNAKLDTEMPNWRDINKSQEFLDWCRLPDPFSGVTRLTMLREAHSKSDARRVMAFFKGFLADEATVAPAKPEDAPPAQPGKPKLEEFAAPGRAKAPAASQQAPGQKETISRSQIVNFYKLVNKGHYRGAEDEKKRLEQMIFDAEREGRIVD